MWICKHVDLRACGCVTMWMCEGVQGFLTQLYVRGTVDDRVHRCPISPSRHPGPSRRLGRKFHFLRFVPCRPRDYGSASNNRDAVLSPQEMHVFIKNVSRSTFMKTSLLLFFNFLLISAKKGTELKPMIWLKLSSHFD